MPEALRSIGFGPAAADEEFTARCQAALDVVQRDLDVTGYGQCRMRAFLDRGGRWKCSRRCRTGRAGPQGDGA